MAPSSPIKVLIHEWVTGGGLAGASVPPSWAAEGLAMRRAIANDFAGLRGQKVRVIVTVDHRWPDEASPWTTIRMEGARSRQWLAGLAREEADYTILIAPETHGVLSGLAAAMERVGASSLGCSVGAIDLTANKAKLAMWLQERGISTLPCCVVEPAQGLPADAHYPAVIKPVDGAGSIDTYYVADPDDLPLAIRERPRAVLQPFYAGVPMSASILVGEQRAWLIGVGTQRMVLQDGRFVYQGGVLPIPCEPAAATLLRVVESVAGLRGFVGVDFFWDPEGQQTLVLEINPRPTTSIVGICRLLPPGRLAAAWLAACGVPGFDPGELKDLATVVHREPPIVFNADGTIGADQGGVNS